MRLIDAEKFKQQITAVTISNGLNASSANKMCEVIDMQQTAYDVGRVIEQLEVKVLQNGQIGDGNDGIGLDDSTDDIISLDDAIEIVKAGMQG